MVAVWNEACLRHAPGAEFWLGLRMPDDELPERAVIIRDALAAAGQRVVPAEPHGDDALLAVHDPGLVAFLRDAFADWEAAGLPVDPGQGLVVPYLFPTSGMLGGTEAHVPAAVWARTGFWCFDTMTPIGAGTWEAARGLPGAGPDRRHRVEAPEARARPHRRRHVRLRAAEHAGRREQVRHDEALPGVDRQARGLPVGERIAQERDESRVVDGEERVVAVRLGGHDPLTRGRQRVADDHGALRQLVVGHPQTQPELGSGRVPQARLVPHRDHAASVRLSSPA